MKRPSKKVRTVAAKGRVSYVERILAAADEALLVEAERGADTTIRAVLESGRPELMLTLERTLAATFARMCAAADFSPSSADEAGVMVSVDDRIELFRRNTHIFYSRVIARHGY